MSNLEKEVGYRIPESRIEHNRLRRIEMNPDVHRAVAVISRPDGAILFVGTEEKDFILPGGKLNAGESADAAMRRELDEEFYGVDFSEVAIVPMGSFVQRIIDRVGLKTGRNRRVDLFEVRLSSTELDLLRLSDPLIEMRWIHSDNNSEYIPRFYRELVIPYLSQKGLIALNMVDSRTPNNSAMQEIVSPEIARYFREHDLIVEPRDLILSEDAILHATPAVYRRVSLRRESRNLKIKATQNGRPVFIKASVAHPDESNSVTSTFENERLILEKITQLKDDERLPILRVPRLLASSDSPAILVTEYLGKVKEFLQVPFFAENLSLAEKIVIRNIVEQAAAFTDAGKLLNSLYDFSQITDPRTAYAARLKKLMMKHTSLITGETIQSVALNESEFSLEMVPYIDTALDFLAYHDDGQFALIHGDLGPHNIHVSPITDQVSLVDLEYTKLFQGYSFASASSISDLVARLWYNPLWQNTLVEDYLKLREDRPVDTVSLGLNLAMEALTKLTRSIDGYRSNERNQTFHPDMQMFIATRFNSNKLLLKTAQRLILRGINS